MSAVEGALAGCVVHFHFHEYGDGAGCCCCGGEGWDGVVVAFAWEGGARGWGGEVGRGFDVFLRVAEQGDAALLFLSLRIIVLRGIFGSTYTIFLRASRSRFLRLYLRFKGIIPRQKLKFQYERR